MFYYVYLSCHAACLGGCIVLVVVQVFLCCFLFVAGSHPPVNYYGMRSTSHTSSQGTVRKKLWSMYIPNVVCSHIHGIDIQLLMCLRIRCHAINWLLLIGVILNTDWAEPSLIPAYMSICGCSCSLSWGGASFVHEWSYSRSYVVVLFPSL